MVAQHLRFLKQGVEQWEQAKDWLERCRIVRQWTLATAHPTLGETAAELLAWAFKESRPLEITLASAATALKMPPNPLTGHSFLSINLVGEPVRPAVIAVLAHSAHSPEFRRALCESDAPLALLALQRWGADPMVRAHLLAAASHGPVAQRAAAITSLTGIKEAPQAQQVAQTALADPASEIQQAALKFFAACPPDERPVTLIVPHLDSSSVKIQILAAMALESLPKPAITRRLIEVATSNNVDEVRAAAAKSAATHVADPRRRRLLIAEPLLGNPQHPPGQALTTVLLNWMAETTPTPDERRFLMNALQSEQWLSRRAAIRTIVLLRRRGEDLDAVVETALESKNAVERDSAVRILAAESHLPSQRERLLAYFSQLSYPYERLKVTILELLTPHLNDPSVQAVFDAGLRDTSPDVRCAALHGWMTRPANEKRRQVVAHLLTDADASVWSQAVRAGARLADQSQSALATWIAILGCVPSENQVAAVERITNGPGTLNSFERYFFTQALGSMAASRADAIHRAAREGNAWGVGR
ncbi:MAG: hypothetical protein SNJ49_15350 [Chloracidobacterium sp.]